MKLHQYDRILREWMLKPQLEEKEFTRNIAIVLNNLRQVFQGLMEPGWTPEDKPDDQLDIEIFRCKTLDSLSNDISIVQELAKSYLNNKTIAGEIDEDQNKIAETARKFRPVAQYCEDFTGSVPIKMSLMSPDGSLKNLKTELSTLINGHIKTFENLISRVETELNEKIAVKVELREHLADLKRIGQQDSNKREYQNENYPLQAGEIFSALEEHDKENLYGWKEIVSYKKGCFDAKEARWKNDQELEKIGQINQDIKFIDEVISSFETAPRTFDEDLNQASYDEAKELLHLHYGFNGQDIDFDQLNKNKEEFQTECCVEGSTIINKIIQSTQIISSYKKMDLLKLDSLYIQELIDQVIEKQDHIDGLVEQIKEEFNKLSINERNWTKEKEMLDYYEDDFARNNPRGLFGFLRKKYYISQKRLAMDNIILTLENMDKIAPANFETKRKRELYGI
ncbi:hypothetical protein JW979_07260 [bacterium]|nr:hypothetical protein [candidate division CSSED10-310 bacterium]